MDRVLKLKMCLKMRKLTISLLCPVIGICSVIAQNKSISGVVTSSEDGQPVIGASVVVMGTTIGTVTDIDGKFVLDVPQNGKRLMISYVGMNTQQVPIKENVIVKLTSNVQDLDEVVVTA